MKKLYAALAVFLLIAVVALLQWRHTHSPGGEGEPLQRLAGRMGQGLPKPYVDGLVIERVQVINNDIVTDIRIPDIKLEALDPAKIPLIRQQEQVELVAYACSDPELRPVLDEGKSKIGRRFYDQDRRLVFEIAVSLADCPAGRQL